MRAEDRLAELLLAWEEAGRTTSVDELCRDHPDLADSLRRRIDALREMDWLSGELDSIPRASGSPTKATVGLTAGCEPVPGYRLVERLGRGGFGEVWKATGPGGFALALKFVHFTDRVAAEQQALDAIKDVRHPHVLTVFGAWQTDTLLVIAMERADGTLLDRWQAVRKEGLPGIPREEVLQYVTQAADAIDYLVARRIQHRDIKPQNLLLIGSQLKVADFGLARLLTHSVTGHTGSMTVAYAAPEFFDGRTTRQSDQYSLAVAYCQLRGGRLPFEGTATQMMAGHVHRKPDLSMLPAEERPAVARALSKRPGDRWPTCKTFVEALSRPEQRPRRISRRRLLSGAASSLALMAGGAALWGWHRSKGDDQQSKGEVRALGMPQSPFNVRTVSVGYVAKLARVVALSNGFRCPIVWDVGAGRVLRELPCKGGPAAALAPFERAEALAGDDDGNMVLFDLGTGREVRQLRGHRGSISCVAFSDDGSRAVTAGTDRTVRVWDVTTGQELSCLRGHEGFVMSAAFGPTGSRVLSGGWDGTVRLWDIQTGKELRRLTGHSSQVYSVAYSEGGHFGLSGGLDHSIVLWDLHKGEEIRRFAGHTGAVHRVAFWGTPHVLSGGDDTVRLWELESGREIWRSPRMPSRVQSVVLFSREGIQHALVGTEQHGVQMWRMPPLS